MYLKFLELKIMENMLKNQQQFLSKIATNDGHGENSAFFDGWKAYDMNPYHPTKNQNGVIQMGLAENLVLFLFFFEKGNVFNFLHYVQEFYILVHL